MWLTNGFWLSLLTNQWSDLRVKENHSQSHKEDQELNISTITVELNISTITGDFQVTTPEIPLLSQQAVTIKGIPSTLPTYNWTLTLIPNWTCSVVTVLLFDAQLPNTWLTNCMDPSTQIQSPTKKVVGYKVLQLIHIMKIKKILGHKTLWCIYTATSSRERDELGQKLCLRSQFAWTEFAQCLCNLWTFWRPLKQSFYMSSVKRKKDPKTHSRIPRKSYQNFEFLKPQQIRGVEQLSSTLGWNNFLKLDRCSY